MDFFSETHIPVSLFFFQYNSRKKTLDKSKSPELSFLHEFLYHPRRGPLLITCEVPKIGTSSTKLRYLPSYNSGIFPSTVKKRTPLAYFAHKPLRNYILYSLSLISSTNEVTVKHSDASTVNEGFWLLFSRTNR